MGGAIRDALAGIQPHDLDFVMAGNPRSVARRVANALKARYYLLDDERNTSRVILPVESNPPDTIDFSAFRGPDLESDLRGRDFTINAIALKVHEDGQLIDPLGGAEDLHQKRLRLSSPHSIEEDPLRILRAARMAIRFGLRIEPGTKERIKRGLPGLERVSAERKRDEIFRILEGPHPARALRILDRLGAIPYIFPELESLKDIPQTPSQVLTAWERTLATVEYLDRIISEFSPGDEAVAIRGTENTENLTMGLLALELGRFRNQINQHLKSPVNPFRSLRGLSLLAALCDDIPQPKPPHPAISGRTHPERHARMSTGATACLAQSLQLSNLEGSRLKTIIENQARARDLTQTHAPPGRRAVYRFFRDVGPAGVEICLLVLADTLATYGPALPVDLWADTLHNCRVLLENWWEKPGENIRPKSFLNGKDLQALFGLSPGPIVGQLLEALREAGAMGQASDYEQAVQFAKEWLEKNP